MKGFLIRCVIGIAAGIIIIMSLLLSLGSLGPDDKVYAEDYSDVSGGGSYSAGTYSNKTYTYAGRTYTLFEQWEPPYQYYPYGDGNLWGNGCGVVSIAIVVSGFKSGEDPITVVQKCQKYGHTYETNLSTNLFPNYLSEFGLTGSYVGPGSEDKVIEHLKNGKPVIVNARGPVTLDDGTNNDRTATGHYITALGLDENGHVFIGDPGANDGTMSVENLKRAVGSIGGYLLIYEK